MNESLSDQEEKANLDKKQAKKRGLDFDFLHFKKSLVASYTPQKKKIKIKRPPKKRLKIPWWLVIVFLVFLFILTIVFDTKLYNTFLLFSSIKNQKILIGFQNSAELRPTGGFWGSFAYLEANKNLFDGSLFFETNPYKKDNPLLEKSQVEMPKPIKEVWSNRPQTFINANWSYDFPQAAKTIEWYFGQGWDMNADAVFAISSLSLIDLLKIIGPVELADKTIISSENFTEVMSKKIEVEYWQNPQNIKVNEPKTILLELAPKIIEKTKKVSKLTLLRYLFNQFEQGRVMAYFNDSYQENLAKKIGISGESAFYKFDYLSINNANLSGNKTSLNVKQKIDYSVDLVDEKVTSHLKISREHLPNFYPQAKNNNYTRVIVPVGSKLKYVIVDGQDITDKVDILDEYDKTTFGFWFSTEPGEEKITDIKYELPYEKNNITSYQLVVQKQPGTREDFLTLDAFGERLFNKINTKSVSFFP